MLNEKYVAFSTYVAFYVNNMSSTKIFNVIVFIWIHSNENASERVYLCIVYLVIYQSTVSTIVGSYDTLGGEITLTLNFNIIKNI